MRMPIADCRMPIIAFALFARFVVSSLAVPSIENAGVSNVTRIAATAYAVVTTDAVPLASLRVAWGTLNAGAIVDDEDWQNKATVSTGVVVGVKSHTFTGLIPAQQYYCTWGGLDASNELHQSAVTSFWTVAGAPTNPASPAPYPPVTVDTNGMLTSPVDFFTKNAAAIAEAASNEPLWQAASNALEAARLLALSALQSEVWTNPVVRISTNGLSQGYAAIANAFADQVVGDQIWFRGPQSSTGATFLADVDLYGFGKYTASLDFGASGILVLGNAPYWQTNHLFNLSVKGVINMQAAHTRLYVDECRLTPAYSVMVYGAGSGDDIYASRSTIAGYAAAAIGLYLDDCIVTNKVGYTPIVYLGANPTVGKTFTVTFTDVNGITNSMSVTNGVWCGRQTNSVEAP
jgi:hypothetical protein